MAIVTVSRTHGSGGSQYARQVGERLGYNCYGSEHLKEANKLALDHFCSLCVEEPEAPSFLDRFEELMANRNFYKTMLLACVYDLALKDNAVFIGMGSQIILEHVPNVLHARVVRRLSDRVRAIAGIKNVSYEDAQSLIEKMDHGKKAFVSHYFDRDTDEPTLYHIMFNSSSVPVDYAVDAAERYVKGYITREQAAEARKMLVRLLLEKRAEIILFKLDMIHDYGKVAFEARDDGSLLVKGVVGGEDGKKKLFAALEGLKEVTRIEDHVKVSILSHIIY